MDATIDKVLLAASDAVSRDSPAVARIAGFGTRGAFDAELFGPVYEPHLDGYLGHKEIYESLRDRIVAERLDRLEGVAEGLRRQGIRCRATAVWGHPYHALVAEEASRGGADLVVVEAGGRLSHEDWQLISTCPAPLLVVRGGGRPPYRTVVAAVDPFHEHGKPAALDLAILRQAAALAHLSGADVRAIHCFVPLAELSADAAFAGASLGDVERAVRRTRQDALAALAAAAKWPSEAAALAEGRPETVLADMANRGEADLVVLGTVSRSKMRSLFLGSTAERLLKGASRCDLLLTKPPGVAARP